MSVPQNFRSAFNGFNREDVVKYIEYLNARHTAQVNQLTSETEFLQEKLNSLDRDSQTLQQLEAAEAERDALKAQLEEMRSRCAQLEQSLSEASAAVCEDQSAKIEALELELKEALIGKLEAETARDEALQAQKKQPTQQRMEEELEYYRRAERIERQARERAEQVYRVTNGALADATVQVEEAAASIGELADRVAEQLALLQNAVSGSKQTLRSAAATMYAVRTGEE